MPIKVAHLVRQYYPSIGGMEEVVKQIALHQSHDSSQKPKIVTLDRLFRNSNARLARSEVVDGVEVTRLPFRGSNRYPLCPQVLGSVTDVDVIHVHGIDFFFDYLAATKAIHRKALVASTHGGFFHTNFMSSLKRIYFKTVTRATSLAYDKIIATSNNDGRLFSEVVADHRLTVIENGVDIERYRDLAAPGRSPALIYFGRWSRNKGLEEIVSLFARLRQIHEEWKLIVAGREYDYNAEDLRTMVAAHRLEDAVQIVANPGNRELSTLIGQSSYFISLSRHEGFGIAPIEAMSAGLIPILSDIPPFRRLVEQSGFGILLDHADTDSAIASIHRLHNAGLPEYQRVRNGVKQFSTRYDWSGIAKKYIDVYNEVAEGS